jgi:hypothetical protein
METKNDWQQDAKTKGIVIQRCKERIWIDENEKKRASQGFKSKDEIPKYANL